MRYPFVIIEFPKQDVTDGVLHIVVCESTLGEICIEPNEGYAVHKIMDYMRLCPGERINESILFNDVAIALSASVPANDSVILDMKQGFFRPANARSRA
jgi:hemolysin activation/secretion protein